MSQPQQPFSYDPLGMSMPAEPVKQGHGKSRPAPQQFQQPPGVPGLQAAAPQYAQPAQFAAQPAQFAPQPPMQQAPAQMPMAPQGFVQQQPAYQGGFPQQPLYQAPAPAPAAAPSAPVAVNGGGSLFARANGQPPNPASQNGNGQPAGPVQAPTIQVEFEVPGSGVQQTGWFHQVIRNGIALVLVFDTNAVGFPTAFPQTVQADMAVHVVGQDVIYIVATTGVRFKFLHYDMCLLFVKGESPYGQT